jgi:hypothetical protein
LSSCNKPAYPSGYSSYPDTIGRYGTDKTVSAYYSADYPDKYDTYGKSGIKDRPFPPSEAENKASQAYTLYVRNSTVKPGDSIDTLINNFGEPGKVVSTEYDFELYIYNNIYTRLFLAAVKDNKVTGFYTDSEDFYYNGITYGTRLETVNQALGKSYEVTDVLTYEDDNYTLNILVDVPQGGTVTGIYLLSNTVKENKYTDIVKKDAEQLLFDLTNSIRARHDSKQLLQPHGLRPD